MMACALVEMVRKSLEAEFVINKSKLKRLVPGKSILSLGLVTALAACGSQGSGKKNPEIRFSDEDETLVPLPEGPMMRPLTSVLGRSLSIRAERSNSINPKLIYAIQGKGTSLTWDIGVTKGAYDRIPMLRGEANAQGLAAGDLVVTGNSSGAVLAGWLTCNGISVESLNAAHGLMRQFPANLVNEDAFAKFQDILSVIRSSEELGSPISSMEPVLNAVTGNGTCVPLLPTVIVASNQDINDNRSWVLGDQRSRSFDLDDYTYSVRNSSFSFESNKIGKACTYFADPVMFKYLTENLTQEERLCDVRVMETAAEVKLAIMASIAEPTYFMPIDEPSELRLVRYNEPGMTKNRRRYNGGFSMPAVVQDVKRLFPNAYAMGTGRWSYGTIESTVMSSWYDVSLNDLQERSRWWFDLEAFPTDDQESELLDRDKELTGGALAARYDKEIELGYTRAIECLQPGKPCLPDRSTLFGNDRDKPAFTKPAGQPDAAEIVNRRGVDGILQ